jgi:hypothetical protein
MRTPTEAAMTEDSILEMLGTARDAARSGGMLRLAEHLDDAMLMAASEYHEALAAKRIGGAHDAKDRGIAGGAAATRIH